MADSNQARSTREEQAQAHADPLVFIQDHVNFESSRDSRQTPDWRAIPELPTSEELMPNWDDSGAEYLSQLPRNNINYTYSSKNQYLEILYRLQREEAITNIRFSVTNFRDEPRMKDSGSTCVYTKVFVLGYLMTRLGPVVRVRFSTERAGKRIKWTHTRRLTPGTVVAITTAADNFRTICKPAVVADKCLQDGSRCTIHLHWAQPEQAVIDPDLELVMVESRAGYFEAQRHCLAGLQHLAGYDTPLDKYLVNGSREDGSPSYVLDNPQMDISSLIHQDQEDHRDNSIGKYKSCDIRDGIPIDIGKYTSLDNSQLEAVHRILTKELPIVQGPPGTGKTFTSVQALRILLASRTPGNVIIVAAETNHAVDQILTHLIKFDCRVVRLGGRTRDEEIKRHSMFNLRRRHKCSKTGGQEYSQLEAEYKRSVKDFENNVKEALPDQLLDPKVLLKHGIISKEQFSSLLNESWETVPNPNRPGGIMDEWLGNSLIDIPARRDTDPVFDSDESEDEGDMKEEEIGLDLDDAGADDVDDEHRLQGQWVGISRKWGGKVGRWGVDTLRIRRLMKKANLWDIEEKYRGVIYEDWQKKLLGIHTKGICDVLVANISASKNQKIHRWHRDTEIIKYSHVEIVGCTTTGLSKYRGVLSALKPRTILIEEAAQSREAVITAGLFEGLQQLILVGDHQQLPPNCETPGLASWPYNLRVSMFERLLAWRQLPYTMLNMQRRMIPSIRELLNPFYDGLQDHPVVQDPVNRPPVPGMRHNSYLFHHNWDEGTDMESMSKFNIMEANMVVEFVHYLIMNGVPTDKITVLTFYRGQRKKIVQKAKYVLARFGPLRLSVSTIDSYQGEENDIIILSLVRSSPPNMPGRAGFVADQNRGVVSISRARRGFYIFGNITNLTKATSESKEMWGSVERVFWKQKRMNKVRGLPIQCKNHGTVTWIDEPETWVGNHGGCFRKCNGIFEDCGHACDRQCHPMSHDKLICQRPCERKLRCGHGCQAVCGDKCYCTCDNFSGTRAHLQQQASQDSMWWDSRSPTVAGNGRNSTGKTFPRNGYGPSHVQARKMPHVGNAWKDWDAGRDDAIKRHRNRLARAPKPLVPINDADDTLEDGEKIRDTWNPVTIGQDGGRKVGQGIVTGGGSSWRQKPASSWNSGPVDGESEFDLLGAGTPAAAAPPTALNATKSKTPVKLIQYETSPSTGSSSNDVTPIGGRARDDAGDRQNGQYDTEAHSVNDQGYGSNGSSSGRSGGSNQTEDDPFEIQGQSTNQRPNLSQQPLMPMPIPPQSFRQPVMPRQSQILSIRPMTYMVPHVAASDSASVSRGEWEKESTVDSREFINDDDDNPDLIEF